MSTTETPEASPRLHWYSLAFIDSAPSGAPIHASTYMGWPEQLVTKPRIDATKRHAGLTPNAVLLSCCYLGNMTRPEVLGE